MTWLGVYSAATPKTQIADNTTVRLDLDNEPQPDALLRIEGGQSVIDIDNYIQGAPELSEQIIDWFRLRDGKYLKLQAEENTSKSEICPGLWLNIDALLQSDLAQVLASLQQGLSTKHQDFVQ